MSTIAMNDEARATRPEELDSSSSIHDPSPYTLSYASFSIAGALGKPILPGPGGFFNSAPPSRVGPGCVCVDDTPLIINKNDYPPSFERSEQRYPDIPYSFPSDGWAAPVGECYTHDHENPLHLHAPLVPFNEGSSAGSYQYNPVDHDIPMDIEMNYDGTFFDANPQAPFFSGNMEEHYGFSDEAPIPANWTNNETSPSYEGMAEDVPEHNHTIPIYYEQSHFQHYGYDQNMNQFDPPVTPQESTPRIIVPSSIIPPPAPVAFPFPGIDPAVLSQTSFAPPPDPMPAGGLPLIVFPNSAPSRVIPPFDSTPNTHCRIRRQTKKVASRCLDFALPISEQTPTPSLFPMSKTMQTCMWAGCGELFNTKYGRQHLTSAKHCRKESCEYTLPDGTVCGESGVDMRQHVVSFHYRCFGGWCTCCGQFFLSQRDYAKHV